MPAYLVVQPLYPIRETRWIYISFFVPRNFHFLSIADSSQFRCTLVIHNDIHLHCMLIQSWFSPYAWWPMHPGSLWDFRSLWGKFFAAPCDKIDPIHPCCRCCTQSIEPVFLVESFKFSVINKKWNFPFSAQFERCLDTGTSQESHSPTIRCL